MKCSVYIATSVDGFIAKPDGDIEWLTKPEYEEATEVGLLSGTPGKIVELLAKEGKRHLYIDGGITIQKFLDAGLIHELTITVIPILLGKGIPLFGNESREQPLELIGISSADSGPIQLRYRVKDPFNQYTEGEDNGSDSG